MTCKVCNKEIPEGTKFCPECGSRQFLPNCINCGAALSADTKFCPNCGRPTSADRNPNAGDVYHKANYTLPTYQPTYVVPVEKKKTPFFKRVWVWIIIVLLFLFFAIGTAPSTPVNSPIGESEYKAMCAEVSYDDLARNPEAKKGQYFKFTGEVIQVIEGYGVVNLRVNVTPVYFYDQFSYYEDTIFVETKLGADGRRILEGDIITLYGVCTGLYTYETIFGATMSIPGLDVGYWEIVK